MSATRTTKTRRSVRTIAAGAMISVGLLGLSGTASAASQFHTLNDAADLTFNQLLGINDHGTIAGYFGSGGIGAPNRSYTLKPPYGQANYVNENYPGSAQTQVTGINNHGTTVGFYLDGVGHSFGFVDQNGQFTKVNVTQLLGINNNGVAVGFTTGGDGHDHAVKYKLSSHKISNIKVGGHATDTAATGINDGGDISGFFGTGGILNGFLLTHGLMKSYSYGDHTNTEVFGVNNSDVIVGFFTNGTATHGFVTNAKNGHTQQIDDPNAQVTGNTVVNGLNNKGKIVGFYVDQTGNTDGFIANR